MPLSSANIPGAHRRHAPSPSVVQFSDVPHVPLGRRTRSATHMMHWPLTYTAQSSAATQSVALKRTVPSAHSRQTVPFVVAQFCGVRHAPPSKITSPSHRTHLSPSHRLHDGQTDEKRTAHDAHALSAAKDSSAHATAPLCVWAVAVSSAAHVPFRESEDPTAQTSHDDSLWHKAHEPGQSPHTSPDAKCVSGHFTTWLFVTRRALSPVGCVHCELASVELSSHRRCVVFLVHRRASSHVTHSLSVVTIPSTHSKHRLLFAKTQFVSLSPLRSTLHVAPIATSSSHAMQTASSSLKWSAGRESAFKDPCTATS